MLYLTIHKPLLQPIHKPILHKPPKYKLIQPQLLIFPIRCLTKIVIWHCSRFLSRTFQVHIYLERHLYVQAHHKHARKIIYRTLLWGYCVNLKKQLLLPLPLQQFLRSHHFWMMQNTFHVSMYLHIFNVCVNVNTIFWLKFIIFILALR